jgi:mono/diheme cytochrome c family protein
MTGTLVTTFVAASLALAGTAAAQGTASPDGNALYQYWCATCHGAGPGHPGTTALAAKYKGKAPGVLEERSDLTPQAVKLFVRRGTSIMPFFRKTEVSNAELDAIADYLTRRKK